MASGDWVQILLGVLSLFGAICSAVSSANSSEAAQQSYELAKKIYEGEAKEKKDENHLSLFMKCMEESYRQLVDGDKLYKVRFTRLNWLDSARFILLAQRHKKRIEGEESREICITQEEIFRKKFYTALDCYNFTGWTYALEARDTKDPDGLVTESKSHISLRSVIVILGFAQSYKPELDLVNGDEVIQILAKSDPIKRDPFVWDAVKGNKVLYREYKKLKRKE